MSLVRIIEVSGRGVPVPGKDIDTDAIIPARYLKLVTFDRMGEFPFYDERFKSDGTLKEHPFNEQRYEGASILFVNENFGIGSSREHAPQALMRWGIKAIVGESYGPIFQGNCLIMGLPTVAIPKESIDGFMDILKTNPETEFTLNLESKTISYLQNGGKGKRSIGFDIPEPYRRALTEGTWDSTRMLYANMDKVRQTAERLQQIRGF